jgi:hypothetical protein
VTAVAVLISKIDAIPFLVIACDKRVAFAQGSEATKQSSLLP